MNAMAVSTFFWIAKMDLRTARALSYLLICRKVAEKHGIPEEDILYMLSMFAVTADGTNVSVGAVAAKLLTAPPDVVDSMKWVISHIKEQLVKMEADPAFMAKLDRGIVTISV